MHLSTPHQKLYQNTHFYIILCIYLKKPDILLMDIFKRVNLEILCICVLE